MSKGKEWLYCYYENAHVPKYEHRRDAMEALFPKESIGVELGVMRGNHSRHILDILKPKKLYMVDPWNGLESRYQNVVEKVSDGISSGVVSIIRDTAENAAKQIPDNLDWVEHDTALGWPQAWSDFLTYLPKVRVGGFIMFDYAHTRYNEGQRHSVSTKILRNLPHLKLVGYATISESPIFMKTDIKCPWFEREEMYSALFTSGGVGVEVGVLHGDNAALLLKKANPSSLTLVDSWSGKYDHYEEVRKRFEEDGRVVLVRSDSVGAASSINDSSLDWVYIDAGHTYDAVMGDLNAYYPKVKPGGYICGHDYNYHIKSGDVVCAVHELLDKHKELSMVGLTASRRSSRSFALKVSIK